MRKLLLILAIGFTSTVVFAQGITTSLISGSVTGASSSTSAETRTTAEQGLPGANIVATHVPSGTTYGTVSLADGRFTMPGMRVGGPYKVTASFIGYETQEKNDIYLSLGNATNIEFRLVETGSQLQEVVITATGSDIFNSDRTGAAINIDKNSIQTVPNISRGLKDFTKLSPLASTLGSGTSFAGANNRYNQFAIDGLVNNDVFGLAASGTNGGQTGIEPISLDAIEEFQINIAPYDVRQGGFTGGGINAVTRSGTNLMQGSAYYFGNSESMVGKNNPNTSIEAKYPDYQDFQAGFRLGGPIIKDKLFFFVNGEITRQKTPLAFAPGTPESNILQSDVDAVVNTLNTIAPGYDPGSYTNIEDETNSNKFLVKLDYNINQNHKLSLRHAYTYGENTDNSRSPNQLRFYNNGLFFPSTTNSTGLEVNSIFGTGKSNRLLIGFTTVRDDRDPLGSAFPFTTVNLTSGRSIVFGSENSSVANQLDQNILSITDDFTMYKGKHTITIGTNNEFYHFYNIFVQNIYGNYSFQNLAGFQSQANTNPATRTAPSFYGIGYSFDPTDDPSQGNGSADFSAFQLGVYGQDDIQLSDKLKVTAGLRLDLPIFPDKPKSNAAFNAAYSEGQTGEVPDTKVLYSPRVGFNFDVLGDRSLQIRGGTGLFTGRVPFVWVSNQFTNNGEVVGTYTVGTSTGSPLTNGITYNVDPYNQPLPGEPPIAAVTPGRGDINVIAPTFKFPQVFRSNLAIDKTLPGGLSVTVEGLFSRTLNQVNFENLQRQPISTFTYAGVDQRPRYTAASTTPTVAGYNQAGRLDPNFNEIIALSNTNKGYTYNFVLQVQKQLQKGFTGSASWSYGDAYDLNSGTSSVAFSNWRFVNQVNGLNNLDLARSNHSAGSRFMAWVSYRKDYLNNMAGTQISLFYNGQQGQPYSYVYNADMNNDGTAGNDLIYVPATQADINLVPITGTNALTVAQQWALLDQFIETDTYLKTIRGQYAERNGSRTPFQNQLDVRLLQEFSIKAGNTVNKLQITFDIMNVGNMINKEWGKMWTVPNQTATLINYTGLADTAPGAALNFASNQPTFTYNGGGQTNNKVFSAFDLTSRWRGQLGVRYIFN
jgi:hypothetical protein